ncbi:radical SAM/SPASM domain-containing protein [Streptomyces venezuelae]|uniref:radical SAM/SPASM domain-containing protein n=1 Tax=Streptomyces venezuelae TaxID=54571 RepID=UPI0037A26660
MQTAGIRQQPTGEPLFVGPTHVDLDLTNACNLACSHCSVASGKPMKDELDTEGMLGVVRDVHALGTLSLTVAGGEPFMREDIVELLAFACSLPGWSVTVITNGTYFTDPLLDQLRTRCPELTVNVSVDGSSPETFDRLRHRRRRTPEAQRQLFEQVTQGIRTAVDAGLKVHTSFTLARCNADDVAATYDLVRGLGARDLLAIKFFSAGRGLDHLTQMAFPYAEWARTMVRLTRQKAAGRFPFLSLSLPSAWEFYLPLHEAGMDLRQAERLWRYRAPLRGSYYARFRTVGDPSGVADLNVVANGDVYPVTLMSGNRAALCGNVRTTPLGDIWEHSPTLAALRGLDLRDLPPTCGTCPVSTLCGGGSRARALIRSGSLAGPDASCPKLDTAERTSHQSHR